MLITEAVNPRTRDIDLVSTVELVRLFNAEDALVSPAVAKEAARIAAAIDAIANRMQQDGRLIYVGAGTAGRLGVLDAAECPPTFNTPPDLVQAIIAGGMESLTHSIEGAEDDVEAARRAIYTLQVSATDSVVGITASGQTPFVLEAIRAARARRALTIGLACNPSSPLAALVDVMIEPVVGEEVIAGSTRLKAGTAQKMVLNQISTGVMIRLGKTYGNLMVDVQPTNSKLRARARRIVELACNLSPAEAEVLLEECGGQVKTAIVSALAHLSPQDARARLAQHGNSVRAALTD